ncbi:MAG: hypothetical protein QOG90_1397 [Actinomycetota bacterium]|jgi:very-short-patch-repair endonuclease
MPKKELTRAERLAHLAADSECVVTVDQLAALKFSDQEIETMVRKKVWQRLHRGVYLLSAGKPTWRQQVRAAMLAAGDEAQLAGRALAAWIGLDGATESEIEIVVAYGKAAAPSGAVVHRTRRLSKARMYDGVAGTSIERLLVDYAARVSTELAERAVESAVTKGLTAERRIWREIAELGDAVPGVVRLARIMTSRPQGKAARSTLEVELFRVIRRSDLPMPVRNFDVYVDGEHFEVDAAYLGVLGAIEADSKRWHTTASQRAKDKRRQDKLEAAGWTFRRFTSADIYGRPDWVIAEIRSLVCVLNRAKPDQVRTRPA